MLKFRALPEKRKSCKEPGTLTTVPAFTVATLATTRLCGIRAKDFHPALTIMRLWAGRWCGRSNRLLDWYAPVDAVSFFSQARPDVHPCSRPRHRNQLQGDYTHC